LRLSACVITTTFLNYKIYVAVRRHAHQIQALQVQQVAQNEEMANDGRLRKSAVTTVYVYLVFLVCYLPQTCMLWINAITLESRINSVINMVNLYTVTLVLFNSSLDPLIYLLEYERHSTQCHRRFSKCRDLYVAAE